MAPTIVRMGGGLITDKVKIKGNTVYMHDKAPLATAIWNDALDPRGGGGGALECSWRGGAYFLRISATRLGEKVAFRYPVSELLDYKKFQKQ